MAERPGYANRLRDVVLDELEAGMPVELGEIAPRAGDEIIQTDDGVAFREQAVAQVRTDETGGPRNEMQHLVTF